MIIAIGYRKQVGKDTSAAYLAGHYKDIRLISFAFKVKYAASIVFGTPLDIFNDGLAKEVVDPHWKMTPREMLQRIATGAREHVCRDVWVKSLNLPTMIEDNPGYHYIIKDLRYLNEALEVKRLGGICVNIQRNTGFTDNHASECELTFYRDWDFTINNDKDEEHLYSQLDNIARFMGLTPSMESSDS